MGENALGRRAAERGLDVGTLGGRKLLYSDVGAMAQSGDVKARTLIGDLAKDLLRHLQPDRFVQPVP